MPASGLSFWGVLWVPLYLAVIFLISARTRHRRTETANEFLNASHSLPTWAASLSFLAYNSGSIEVIGMSAMAAQYGVQALHFYWIGGIPGMIFLGWVVVPLYVRSGARSLPEYLGTRFGAGLRLLNAVLSMLGTCSLAGAALYALAQVLHAVLGYSVPSGAAFAAAVVLVYVLLGGIRATVHTSIFQLLVMVAGLLPLLFKTLRHGGNAFAAHPERWHLWRTLPVISPHSTLDRFGVVLGLGFVISFSYWCTDFVIVQRTLTAQSLDAARKVPVIAGFGKLLIAFLVVLPGVAYPALLPGAASHSFDEAIPRLMAHTYGPTLLGLGIAALLASLMAAIAGNVSGFSAVWTEEVYRVRIRPGKPEQHYIAISRWAILICCLLAGVTAYAAGQFADLMEFLQLVVALFYAPLFAVVLASFLSRRTTERQACWAIAAGGAIALALQIGMAAQFISFGSQMTANFYIALISFSSSALLCLPRLPWRMSAARKAGRRLSGADKPSHSFVLLATLLLLACIALNIVWW